MITHGIIKSPNVLLQDLNGEAVLLNLKNGRYYGLDENSYHMYQILISSGSIEAAYETLLQDYAVEPDKLRSDLEQFLDLLLENGLVDDVGNQVG